MAFVSFSIPEKAWAGLNTRFRPESNYVQDDQFTSGSYNFFTDFTGAIVKVPGGTLYSNLSNVNNDQYEAIFSDGIHHLLEVEAGTLKYSSGDGVFHTVTSGYSTVAYFEFAEYLNRIYFDNGVDPAQVYDRTAVYGGVTYTVPRTKAMGAQAPGSAVTFAADSAGGAVPAGAHTYEVTFLYYGFEESNGGPASAVHTVANPNNTVNLTAVPIGGYGVTARKIYRDNNDGNYLLVGTILDNTTTTFSDTAALGTTPIPTDNGIPPIYSLTVEHLDRIWMAGVAGNPSVLYWSAAGQPDIFNANNFLTVNARDFITGLAVYFDRVVVFNRHSMGQILNRDSATFRYSEITPNIGCIDNRSIQTRTIRGVPTLIWLSEFGWYEFNGSSVNAISTEIDDQVQFNLQQGSATNGSDTENSQSQFQAGTSSPGIDLITNPNFIQTRTPVRQWQTQTDWEGGSSLTNVSDEDGTNTIKVPTHFLPAFSAGLFSNTQIDGTTGNLELPTQTAFTGESHAETSKPDFFSFVVNSLYFKDTIAQAFVPSVNGTLNTWSGIDLNCYDGNGSGNTLVTITINSDAAGIPGGVLSTQTISLPAGSGTDHHLPIPSITFNVALTGGTKYWLVVNLGMDGGNHVLLSAVGVTNQAWSSNTPAYVQYTGGAWQQFVVPNTSTALNFAGAYTYTQTTTSNTGSWISPYRDSFCDVAHGAVLASLLTTTTYPAGTHITALLQGTNTNPTGTPVWTTTDTISDPSGTNALIGTGYRYWQVILTLTAPNMTVTPLIAPIEVQFSNTAIWISEFIDHTTDVVSLDVLTPTQTTPAGTSVVLTIATSADNITYSSFVAFGSQVTQRYSKIKAVLTATTGNDVSPILSNILFSWTLTSNLISDPINTGATPAGWGLFQSSFTPNDGSVSFFVRTAATSGGLAAASFVAVTNGNFITATVFPWIQYKVVLTNHDALLANVKSVTINWFITLIKGIRAASMFYKKRYYMAAAEYGQTANNVVYVYDEFGAWHLIRNVSISTLGLFFNLPYYGDGLVGRIVNWLTGNTNVGGTNIPMAVFTKAFSQLPSNQVGVGADEMTIRWVRSLVIKLHGTGATITPTYSMDGGTTFLPMVLVDTGAAFYTSPNDGILHAVRFVPVGADISSKRSVLIQIFNNDQFPVSILNMRIKCITSRREVLNG